MIKHTSRKVMNFRHLLGCDTIENSTACTHPDLNQRPKDYCKSFISRYSPPPYELSYLWNLSDSNSSVEMTLLPCKRCYFFKLSVENGTVSTEPYLNQQRKDYCQILISHYCLRLYHLSYQWNPSYEYVSTELKLLPYEIFSFQIVSRKQYCIH